MRQNQLAIDAAALRCSHAFYKGRRELPERTPDPRRPKTGDVIRIECPKKEGNGG